MAADCRRHGVLQRRAELCDPETHPPDIWQRPATTRFGLLRRFLQQCPLKCILPTSNRVACKDVRGLDSPFRRRSSLRGIQYQSKSVRAPFTTLDEGFY